MKRIKILSFILCLSMFSALIPAFGAQAASLLTLKYSGGGSVSQWSVQEATVGAPACADIDKDGKKELVFTALDIFCLDGATGKTKWSVPSGCDRKNASGSAFGRASNAPVIADIDKDGQLDIVTFQTNYAKGQTCIGVYDKNGYFKKGFPKYTEKPVYAAVVSDLDKDGKMEICVGMGTGSTAKNAVCVYNCTGGVRSGWPVKYGFGLYSDSMTTADINGDGVKEIIFLYDEERPVILNADGSEYYVTDGKFNGLAYSAVPVAEDIAFEERLYNYARNNGGRVSAQSLEVLGNDRQFTYVISGTYGGVVADDLDGDGKTEIAFSSMVVDGMGVYHNMTTGGNSYEGITKYFTAFILETNRERYKNEEKGYDWTAFPRDTGKVISMDNPNQEFPDCSPVVADLQGDGEKEIIFTSTDGLVHCFSLDGKEKNNWPLNLNSPGKYTSYAAKPTVADLNKDGVMEVIVATYTQRNQKTQRGCLYILDWTGKVQGQVTLPCMWGSDKDVYYANGCVARPCVADIDNDGKLEIALTTKNCGVVAYEVNTSLLKYTIPRPSKFIDIPYNKWYTDATLWCYEKGIISGTSGNTFSPDGKLTRAMFITILSRVEGINPADYPYTGQFTDVADGTWYTNAVEWAYKESVTSGTGENIFSPNANVTREQLATFFFNYSKLKNPSGDFSGANLSKFTDASSVSLWALESVQWAVAKGLISGTSPTTLSPKDYATRAQAALIFKNYIENYLSA